MVNDSFELALKKLTTQIVSSYVTHNEISGRELPGLIQRIHESLKTLALSSGAPPPSRPIPAVPPKKSVYPDYIICLEDGKKLKLLRRHLLTVYDMTPEQYRERWDLPPEYPMVAPNYAHHRSNLARKIGLGHRR